jgi:hypothetical protein
MKETSSTDIVIVHTDTEFQEATVKALSEVGWGAKGFSSPFLAFGTLSAGHTKLLITGLEFGPGRPHGVSLALMARMWSPSIKTIFTASAELKPHTIGLGEFFEFPTEIPVIFEAAERLLKSDDNFSE